MPWIAIDILFWKSLAFKIPTIFSTSSLEAHINVIRLPFWTSSMAYWIKVYVFPHPVGASTIEKPLSLALSKPFFKFSISIFSSVITLQLLINSDSLSQSDSLFILILN